MDAQPHSTQPAPWWRIALIGRNPKRTLVRLLVLITLCLLARAYAIFPILVEGPSMEPNYRDGSRHFINRLAFVAHPPRRGDVVAIRLAGPHVMYLKRIVGLPGETISFHHGRLLINGQPIEEPYQQRPCNWELPPDLIGPDHYYVVGDNRTMPAADHHKGKAERERILGRIVL